MDALTLKLIIIAVVVIATIKLLQSNLRLLEAPEARDKGLEVVNATGKAVFAVDSYPGFYNLTGIGCATETGEGYMIAYGTAQNNVFSDLRKPLNITKIFYMSLSNTSATSSLP